MIVEPLDHATHRVTLKCRDDLHELMGGPVEPKLVSDRNVALLSRQMAFHSNVKTFYPIFFLNCNSLSKNKMTDFFSWLRLFYNQRPIIHTRRTGLNVWGKLKGPKHALKRKMWKKRRRIRGSNTICRPLWISPSLRAPKWMPNEKLSGSIV